MFMAKIYQKRHQHTINGVVVEDEIHYKILFSHPKEMKKFEAHVRAWGGSYKFNKDTSKQEGVLPKFEGYKKGTYCWCDWTTHYLLHTAGYELHSTTSPYKCEIYIRNEN